MEFTIRDIARLAKTSIASVSLVLNGKDEKRVRAEKRDEILAIVHRYGYCGSTTARGLRTNQSFRIAICFEGHFDTIPVNGHFSTYEMLRFAAQALNENGYGLGILQIDTAPPAAEIARRLLMEQVDGYIFLNWDAQRLQGVLAALGPIRKKAISIGTPLDDPAAWAGIDYAASTRIGMEHLWQRGCRRIALLAYDYGIRLNREKTSAYESFLGERGGVTLPLLSPAFVSFGAFHEAARLLLEPPYEADAIFMLDNFFASAVQLALAGSDTALLGYGDACFADVCCPPIDYLRMPIREVTAAGVAMLLRMLDKNDSLEMSNQRFLCELTHSAPQVPGRASS